MTNYHRSKYVGVTRGFLTVGGICYIAISAILFISVLWEHSTNGFDFLNFILSTLILTTGMTKGIIALKFRKNIHEKATTGLGVMFILFGGISFLFLFSLTFIVAGILIIISAKAMHKTAKYRGERNIS